uniref:ENTH domain-containing protein n=1 Tax=Ditylenchus dipsaci TaxID=166011 RepID=A0A915DZG8_9BILA
MRFLAHSKLGQCHDNEKTGFFEGSHQIIQFIVVYPALAAPASAPLTSSTASNDPWSPVGQPVHPLPSYAAATSAAHYHYSIFPRIFCCPVHQPTQLLHKMTLGRLLKVRAVSKLQQSLLNNTKLLQWPTLLT